MNLQTGNPCPPNHEDGHYFDSTLEYHVWQALRTKYPKTLVQWTVRLAGSQYWQCDFYIPERNWIIEAKGPWINEKSFYTERKLFCLQFEVAAQQFDNAFIVSDKEFTIDNLNVIHYTKV